MSGYLRQPRLLVLADGSAVSGVLSAQVISTAHATADRFRVTLAASPIALTHWTDADRA